MNKIIKMILLLVFTMHMSVITSIGAETNDLPVLNKLDDDAVVTTTAHTVYKEPISKRKIAKKFLAAMGGVIISSLILFLSLSLYNRLRSNFVKQNQNFQEESLTSPTDLTAAVKTFLDKTDWK